MAYAAYTWESLLTAIRYRLYETDTDTNLDPNFLYSLLDQEYEALCYETYALYQWVVVDSTIGAGSPLVLVHPVTGLTRFDGGTLVPDAGDTNAAIISLLGVPEFKVDGSNWKPMAPAQSELDLDNATPQGRLYIVRWPSLLVSSGFSGANVRLCLAYTGEPRNVGAEASEAPQWNDDTERMANTTLIARVAARAASILELDVGTSRDGLSPLEREATQKTLALAETVKAQIKMGQKNATS